MKKEGFIGKNYDWKITLWKAFKGFLVGAVPLVVIEVIPILQDLIEIYPQEAVYIGLIIAVLTGISNFYKHRKD